MRLNYQRGYFLFIAVVLVLVIGLMGMVISYLFSNRAMLSAAQQKGLSAFYMAESGLEMATRLLTMPALTGTSSRLTCASITGASALTNAALGSGTLTVTTINSSPIYATTTLNGAITATATSITLTSASGFAASGRVVIDREGIDYAAISGSALVGVTRGTGGSSAASHANGAGVGQYQCSLDSQAGIPSIASPSYKREIEWDVQLQDGWVAENVASSNFTLLRWNRPTEESWTNNNLAGGANAANLNSISMLSNADGWAVANVANSNLNFLRWNGSAWSLVAIAGACGTQDLFGVSMVSSQEGWAVGGRYRPACASSGNFRYDILRWNGSSWVQLTPSTSPSIPADASNAVVQNLLAVHMQDTNGDGLADVGFAVGVNGLVLRYNGSNWVTVTSFTTRDLRGVFTVSASEAWAVGANGEIWRWNGSTWSSVASPVSNILNGIAMLDTDNDGDADVGWIAGASGKILSYDGSSWSEATDIGSTNLLAVAIANSKDAWVVGASGTIQHWDGSAWSSVNSGVTRSLNSISLVAPKQQPAAAWQQVFR